MHSACFGCFRSNDKDAVDTTGRYFVSQILTNVKKAKKVGSNQYEDYVPTLTLIYSVFFRKYIVSLLCKFIIYSTCTV